MYYNTDSEDHKRNLEDLADTRTDNDKQRDDFWTAQDKFWEQNNYCVKCGFVPVEESCNCEK